jgi:hypothetical protein
MFGTVTGWDLIFTQLNIMLGKLFGIQLLRGSFFLASLVLVVVWVLHFSGCKWNPEEKAFAVYLCLLTGGLWLTLALMTVFSGVKYDFSSDGRFSMPIALGWLVLGGVSVGKMPARSVTRSAVFYTFIVPIAFSAVFFAASGLSKHPYSTMPSSKTAWIESNEPSHAAFLSNLVRRRARKPDLLVATDARFMTELGVPGFFTFRAVLDDHHVYFSSVDLEVWAMIDPADEHVLLQKFSKAIRSERVSVPDGFPYVFYIFNFVPPSHVVAQSSG